MDSGCQDLLEEGTKAPIVNCQLSIVHCSELLQCVVLVVAQERLQERFSRTGVSRQTECPDDFARQLEDAVVTVLAARVERTGDDVDLLERQVGRLHIGGPVALADVGELVETDVQMVVVLLLDDHGPGCQVAQTLVILRHEGGDQADGAAGAHVDGIEQPAQEVGADGRFAPVHPGHTQVHQAFAHALPVVEHLAEQRVEGEEGEGKEDDGGLCRSRQLEHPPQRGETDEDDGNQGVVDEQGEQPCAYARRGLFDADVLSGDDVV